MEKMLVRMKTLDDVQAIVNSANRLECRVDLTDGEHVVDAKKFVGVVSLNPAKDITVLIDGDKEDYRNMAMWLKGICVGRLVEIYADTPEADAIQKFLNGETESFVYNDENETIS